MDNNNLKHRVIAIGSDHYNTYGIVRSLGEEGIKSDVIILGCKSRDSFVLQSRYIEFGIGCPKNEEAIVYLNSRKSESRKDIIICCSDEAEELVLAHFDELSLGYILPACTDFKETTRLMNKEVITELAKFFDIRVPETWLVKNRQIPSGIQYPCITKPLTSTCGHKNDIVVCRNEIELLNVVKEEKRCADYVVQEYIKYDKEVSILGAVLENGEVLFSGCIDKLRTCMIGTTSFGAMVENRLLGDNVVKLESLMRSTGYRGLFSAEFLIKDSQFYFLEVNFRNDGNTYVATASGLNLPFLYVQSLTGEKIQYKEPIYPCFFMLEIEDFLTMRHNSVSIRQWIRDIRTANTFLVFNKKDIKPFRKKIQNFLLSTIRRLFRKLV